MQKTATILTLALILFIAPKTLNTEAASPLLPNAGGTASSTLTGTVAVTNTFPAAPTTRTREDMTPTRLSIPLIKLNDPIENMGVLANGELAVPSGATNNIGWYADGTLPGDEGSAVLDAHVFAAFKNLRYVKPGDDIYVTSTDGVRLHFKVETSEVFKLGQLTSNYLFERDDAKRLTLITCAGKLTPDHSTYDHRLVVSAILVP